MKKNYLIRFTIVLLLSASLYTAGAQAGEVKISPSSVRPGDFLMIRAEAPENSTVRAVFLKTTHNLQQDKDNKYIGLLAVSYFTAPGIYPLRIEIKNDSLEWLQEYRITVVERKFPEQRIRVKESLRKAVLSPQSQNFDAVKSKEARNSAMIQNLPPLWEGEFIRPANGRLSTEFGVIRYVNNIENGRHSGIDIAAPTGTPVFACNQGVVAFAGELNSTGLTVMIHHGLNLFTSYGHLSKIEVNARNFVQKGALIGRIGATGLATGPHLHLTFRIGEISVDPFLFLDKKIEWED